MSKLPRLILLCALTLNLPLRVALADDASTAASTAAPVAAAVPAAAPNAAAAPAAAPTAPFLVTFDKINSGDTAWMLTSTALVLMMTIPGLALFYAGMVRKKNILSTMMQSFAITSVVSILWWIVGYSLAFTPGSTPYIGGLSRAFFHGMAYMHDAGKETVSHLAPTIPETVYAMFQATFAIITPALICGSFAERMKFSAMLWFMSVWLIVVYCPVAHWMWEPSGWMAATQLDFAGGTVVHINAGIAGLASALMLGKRDGLGKVAMAPSNVTLTVIGASLLWVGWFGFNAGSAVVSDGRAGMAFAVTHIATAAAALSWMFTEWLLKGKPSVLGIASGAVAGLVAITPASGFVSVDSSVLIGAVAGVVCYLSATSLKRVLGYDDALDAFGVHCIGGIVGALLTGALVSKEISGATGSVLLQLRGVTATLVWSFAMSMIILKILDMTIGLRVTTEEEREGLDIALHGESIE
ncbi:MAG TPA: ammonium transporter [Steroidobacteraceae bacterium]|nr:ammonium transporter [Steroidobacteraceae bacterium]HVC02646.1 ammonium transporter [Steroidobacteraceae bacterium]